MTRISTGAALVTRILVVDDEPQIRKALSVNLSARGYDVDLAASGEEGLTLAAANHPDLVLLDIGLPGIDGIEVVRGLRGWSAVPIIMLSVRDSEGDKVRALDAGADDYVSKPFGMDEVLARMRAALRRHQPVPEQALVTTEHFRIDLGDKSVQRTDGGADVTPHADGMGDRRGAGAPPGPAGHPATTAPGRVGAAVRAGDELPARAPRGDPQEARTRTGPPAVLHHRAGHRLPLHTRRSGHVISACLISP